MSESARLRRCEEKKPLEAQPRGDESDIDAEVEHLTQFASDVYVHCMEAKDTEPSKLDFNIQELAKQYASNFPVDL
jgi:hypothetical protein